MNMNKMLVSVVAAAGLALAGSASALTVTNGGFTLSDTTFGSALGVHATDGDSGNSITGTIGTTSDTVTLTSGETLNVNDNGQGLATFDGPFDDLSVIFTAGSLFDAITFAFENARTPGAPVEGRFDVSINGGAATFTGITLSQPNLNGFTISGGTLQRLDFTFRPGVADAKQFRLRVGDDDNNGAGGGAVPEPAAWALMIMGFGGVGGVIRRRRMMGAGAAA
jgi:hypothetical protein